MASIFALEVRNAENGGDAAVPVQGIGEQAYALTSAGHSLAGEHLEVLQGDVVVRVGVSGASDLTLADEKAIARLVLAHGSAGWEL